jgi:drug/metabolite transporter (DMT)-like permease
MVCGSLAFALMATMAHALGSDWDCDWRVIAVSRTFLAMVFATALTLAAGARLVFWGPRSLWIRSIAGSISLVCTFFAFTRLPVSHVLTLTNTFPIWVALLSWPLLRERPPARIWLFIASGILGVYLIQKPHLAEGNFASLIALGSSVSTAVAMIGLHRLHYIDPRAIVVHFSTVSLLFCIASFFFMDGAILMGNALEGWPLGMLLGVGITATIGQLFLTKAFAEGDPSKVSVVGLSQIVFAVLLEESLGKQAIDATTLLGMGLVLVPAGWLMIQPGEQGIDLASELK